MAQDADKLFERLKSDAEELVLLASDLFHDRAMWRELVGIAKANPSIPSPAYLMNWLTTLYAKTQVVAVRRLAEPNSGVISVGALLVALRDNPEVVTRSRCLMLSREGPEWAARDDERAIEGWFVAGREHLDSSRPAAALQRLGEAVLGVKRFVDQRVAHWDRNAPEIRLRMDELDKAIDLVGELVCECNLLLRGAWVSSLVPTPQLNWKSALTVPWIRE